MQTLTLEQAQSHLAEIIEKLAPDEEIVLTRDGRSGRFQGSRATPILHPLSWITPDSPAFGVF